MSVSVVIVAYNAGPALARCLSSLEDEPRSVLLQVIVVNNGIRDEGVLAAEGASFVEVLEAGENIGFAEGCNRGAERAHGDILVFLNPDTVVATGAMAELAATLEDRSIGIAMARLRLLEQPELLNSAGNVVHLSGIAWAGGHGDPAEALSELREIAFPSGAAMAVRRDVFEELGGFTAEFFMYQEDLEFGWRARLRGLRIVVTPAADVYHDYEFGRHARKSYYLERNRLVFVLSAYSVRLLVTLAPVLLAAEAGMLVLALKQGWFRQKLDGWGWLVRHAGWLREHRRETQQLRRVPDRVVARQLTPILDPQMVDVPGLVRLANPLLDAYWAAARQLL